MNRIIGVKEITTANLRNGDYPRGYKYMITPQGYSFNDGKKVLLVKDKEKIQEAKKLLTPDSYFIMEMRNSYGIGVGSFTIKEKI